MCVETQTYRWSRFPALTEENMIFDDVCTSPQSGDSCVIDSVAVSVTVIVEIVTVAMVVEFLTTLS